LVDILVEVHKVLNDLKLDFLSTVYKPAKAAIVELHPSKESHMAKSEVLNVRETARELCVHENTVRNLEKKGTLKAIRLPGSGFRRFLKEDVDLMREEMWSQFAPETELPAERRKPAKRRVLTDEDYEA
jgi:hypothetical protein